MPGKKSKICQILLKIIPNPHYGNFHGSDHAVARAKISMVTRRKQYLPKSFNYLVFKYSGQVCTFQTEWLKHRSNANINNTFGMAGDYWSQLKVYCGKLAKFTLRHVTRKCYLGIRRNYPIAGALRRRYRAHWTIQVLQKTKAKLENITALNMETAGRGKLFCLLYKRDNNREHIKTPKNMVKRALWGQIIPQCTKYPFGCS